MSQMGLAMILMNHINPSSMAQSASQQSGGADANQDADMLMAAAPQTIQDKVDLGGSSGGAAAQGSQGSQGSPTYSQPASQGSQGNSQISAADIAALVSLSVPGGPASKPPDPSALATLAVPIGQHIDMKG